MLRVKFVAVFGLLLVALVIGIAACAAPQTSVPTQAPAPTQAAASAEPVTLRFAVNEAPEELDGFKNVIAQFEKANPNIKVTVDNVPDDAEFLKKLAADVAAQTPPDVFVVNYRFIGPFAVKGALTPMDKYLAGSTAIKADDFYPAALKAYQLKGQQMCMPMNLSQLGVYYNKTMFEKAGVPLPTEAWTWNDFLAAAKALTKDTNGDGKTDQFGAGISTSTIRLLPFIWAHGGDLVDNAERPTTLTLDKGAAFEAFQWFVNLQAKEHVVPDKEAEATQSSQARFQDGTLGMFFQSRVVTGELREAIEDKFEWDIAPMPQDKARATILHSDGFCMPSAGKNQDATWKLIEFFNTAAGQSVMAQSGRTVPSLQAVANSDAFLKSTPPASNQVYLNMAPYVRAAPLMSTWSEVEGAVNKEIKRAFYGDATAEEAAKAAVESTKQYFQQNLTDLGSP